MHHTHLGRTGLSVSRLCLGTMTFGLQCDEATSLRDPRPRGRGRHHLPRHRRRLSRSAAASRPPAAPRRSSAAGSQGQRARLRRGHQVLRRRWARSPWDQGNVAQAHPRRRSTRRCGGCAPTTSTSTSCTAPTPRRRSTRRCGALDDLVRAGQGALRRLLQLPRLPGRPRARPQRGARPRALRLRAAALQPAVPRDRARAAAAVPRGGRRRHPVQPARGRPAHRQAPTDGGPTEGTRFTLGNAGATYQDRYWHEREFDTVDAARAARRRGGHVARHARRRVGAGQPGDHRADRRREPPEQLADSLRRPRHHPRRRPQGAGSTS